MTRIGSSTAITVADDQPTFWARVRAGAWEPGMLAVVEERVGPGTVLIDLGAWVGPVSLLAASLGGRVIAVEADPSALDQLKRNLAVNPDVSDRVTVVPRAVSSQSRPVRLGARRKPGDSMSSVLLATSESGWTVETVTPGALADMLGPGERLVVKLDIEGGEYDLLPVLAPLLDRPETALLVSFHPQMLREADHPDVRGITERALAALSGFASFAVERNGPVARSVDPDALEIEDTWLFERA